MKKKKSIPAFLILLFFISILPACEKNIDTTGEHACENPFPGATHPKRQQLEDLMQKYVKKGLPGMSVLLEDSAGAWAGAAGFADIENNVKFQPCQVSKGASITKMLMGTLTFKLQEEGKLNINDSVSKYIDNAILKKISNAEGKTIKQLMNHTTGIFDLITSSGFYLAVINNPNKDWKQEELLEFVYGVEGYELNNPYPAHYSSTNTLLLSMCIEKATGEKHEELLREKILDPVGMVNTFYQGREAIPTTAAQGYFDLHNNGQLVNVSNLVTGSGNGYGGIYSNVFDMRRFIRSLLVEKTILSAASLSQMQEFVQEDTDFFTGNGIIRKFTGKSDAGIGHTGRDLGYSADLFYFPGRNITMVFFVNYGTDGESALKPVFREFESELTDMVLKR